MDFVGPFEVLSYINKLQPNSAQVFLVAENLDIIQAFNGMKIVPEYAFATCPDLDILVVPGGKGRFEAMHNPKIREFVLNQSKHTKYMTFRFVLVPSS